jgi:hypothetical protein
MTELACVDGPATAAVSDRLVAVSRAAVAAPPFCEGKAETGWFAEELAGEVPTCSGQGGTRPADIGSPGGGGYPRHRDERAELSTGPSLFTGPSLSTGATRCDWARRQRWRFSRMPAAPWPPPTHMVTRP